MSTSDTQPPSASPDLPSDATDATDAPGETPDTTPDTTAVAETPEPAAAVAPTPRPAPVPAPAPPALSDDELVALEVELATATEALLDTIATWLSAWWEQPILQVLTRNPTRSIAGAAAFPALKVSLRELQDDARRLVDEAIEPVLAPAEVNPNGQFTETVNSPISLLLGLIGRPIVEAGYAPASIGFDPAGNGFRVRALPEHGAVVQAAVIYRRAAERTSDKRQQLERDEQARLRTEVEALWGKA
jgi:hypothetical protein